MSNKTNEKTPDISDIHRKFQEMRATFNVSDDVSSDSENDNEGDNQTDGLKTKKPKEKKWPFALSIVEKTKNEQHYIWVPKPLPGRDTAKVRWQFDKLPKRVWMSLDEYNPAYYPQTNYEPKQGDTHVLLEYANDYLIENMTFYFKSSKSDGDIWVLLEFERDEPKTL